MCVPWISLAIRVVDPHAPLDGDTTGLFNEAFGTFSWSERFGIWSHSPHPFGVLLQQAFLRATAPLGFGPQVTWSLLLVICLATLLCIVLIWAWLLIRKQCRKDFTLGMSIAVPLIVLPLSPSVWYSFATLEEDAIGLTLFAACLLVIGIYGQPRGVRGLIAYILLISLMWSWHLQYGVILSLASLFAGATSAAFARFCKPKKVAPGTSVQLILAGLTPFVIHGLLHFTGPVRYTSYTDNFPTIIMVVDGRAPFNDYIAIFLSGMATALLGSSAVSPFVLIGFGVAYVSILIFLTSLAIMHRDSLGWFLWITTMALMWPFLYEPTSLERWTAISVALLLLVPVLASHSVALPLRRSVGSNCAE